MNWTTITPAELRHAARVQERINDLRRELLRVVNATNGHTRPLTARTVKPRRPMSPAAKAKLRKIAKARWAAARKAGRTVL